MTIKKLLNAALIELDKIGAPSLLLEQYIYFINKAINQYCNKQYNTYDVNQQSTDNLRALKVTKTLPVINKSGSYICQLPDNYFHLLCLTCKYKIHNKGSGCAKDGDIVEYKAHRLTADAWGEVMRDYYNKPRPQKPYYYINKSDDSELDLCEIRCGNNSNYELIEVNLDYLKTPQILNLTQKQIDLIKDTTQELEFPEYVCYEIINELVTLIMENSANQRLQTFNSVTQSIVNPVQQQMITAPRAQ